MITAEILCIPPTLSFTNSTCSLLKTSTFKTKDAFFLPPNGKWIIVKCINCWKGSYKLQMNKNLRMKETVLACIWLGKAVSFLRAYLADSYLVWKKKVIAVIVVIIFLQSYSLNINSFPLLWRLCDWKDLPHWLRGQYQRLKGSDHQAVLYNLVLLLSEYTILQVKVTMHGKMSRLPKVWVLLGAFLVFFWGSTIFQKPPTQWNKSRAPNG